MPYIRPMLGNLELQLVQKLDVGGSQALAEHEVPELEGDLIHFLGRMAARITLKGVVTGIEAGKGLKDLREKFRAAEPVDFVADITTATKVNQVLIEEMTVRELAGKPERFEYAFALREYIASMPPASEEPQEPIVPQPDIPEPIIPDLPVVEIDEGLGTLIVEVILEGRLDYDYRNVAVIVEGKKDDGSPLSQTLKNRTENIWVEEDFPAGEYAVTACADSQSMSGSSQTVVQSGKTAQVTIALHAAPSNIAKTFVVHFRMDNAFVEPGLCQVLLRAAEYAESNPYEKLIILGHTDLVGSEEYNQNLSERRARSVYAFLTFGRDDSARKEAVDEWDTLRQTAAPWKREIQDNWGTREYQFMLQDLNYYLGNIDGIHGPKTTAAVRAFQLYYELTPIGFMDDPTWRRLIEEYLGLCSLAIPECQFFQNGGDGCNGGVLKWLGAGEQDPVKSTQDAWRPNRRTELLFVQGEQFPCEVPKPRTYDKLNPGGSWCLGPDLNQKTESSIKRVNFLSRDGEEPGKWLVQPAEPGRTIVGGTIIRDTNDGPPFAHAKYVLIAPDGEYLHTDVQGNPDLGERPQGDRRGEPIPNQADENGNYGYPEETPVGTYILEIQGIDDPRLARWRDDEESEARGTIISQQLGPSVIGALQLAAATAGAPASKSPNAVVQGGPVAPPPAKPQIIISGAPVVVVTKSYTNPARKEIILKTERPFRGKGTFSFNSQKGSVRFFKRAAGGKAEVIPAGGREYSGLELTRGVKLYAEGIENHPSGSVGDVILELALKSGPQPVDPPATASLTAISLDLDICDEVSLSGTPIYLNCLPDPPSTPPAPASANDRWYKGGTVYLDPDPPRDNAVLRIGIEPDLACILVLRHVKIAGDAIIGLDNKAAFFDYQRHAINSNPITFAAPYSATGGIFRIRGVNLSRSSRDTGFQLGFFSFATGSADPNYDGDRVSATVIPIPLIQLESSIVLVRKPPSRPRRSRMTLKTSGKSSRPGKFNVSSNSDKVRIYEDMTSQKEITIPAVLTKEQLTKGVDWFVEGVTVSSAADDIELTLSLDPDPSKSIPDAPPATARITAVELTLDICASRKGTATPDPLPSPADHVRPPGVAADKWFGGRFVHVQDTPGKHHGRALLRVHKPKPLDLKGNWKVVLHRVAISSDDIDLSTQSRKLELFKSEKPSAIETAEMDINKFHLEIMPDDFGQGTDPVMEYWVQGAEESVVLQDTGFQIGLDGTDKDGKSILEDDGDRISMTVVRLSKLHAEIQSTQPLGLHQSNPTYTKIPPSEFERGSAAAITSSDFDESFNTNEPLVLVHGSLPQNSSIELKVTAAPVGVPVSWSAKRDIRSAPANQPQEGGDHPDIIALSPNPIPTLVPNSNDPLRATLATDAVGSFQIRPYVDCNGNKEFDYDDNNREPFILMNLVLIRVGGTIITGEKTTSSNNNSIPQPQNIRLAPPNPRSDNGQGVIFYSGDTKAMDPDKATVHCIATIVVVGGGQDGRRGLDRLFPGWINNLSYANVTAIYRDPANLNPSPNDLRREQLVFASNRPIQWDRTVVFVGTNPPPPSPSDYTFIPGLPDRIEFPILDTSPFGGLLDDEGTGGDRAVGLEGAHNRPPVAKNNPPSSGPQPGVVKNDLPIGQTWEVHMWDAPSRSAFPNHFIFNNFILDSFRYNLKFRSDLCFWTNKNSDPKPLPWPIMGPNPGPPYAACCLYATVQTNTWEIDFYIEFDRNTHVGQIKIPGIITLAKDSNPTRLAIPVAGQYFEVYRPISYRLQSWDASI